ncbi:hypothetical protein OESDEN_00583 [Oesophagostomum dentatum]|uniref:Protein kinase domain-containing protein n=1 Tax=Oesophagostomum dentatum TaxID=61180 RepID=A0A0B1TVF4_OESDE|nr:hypothetical protein OESDEN_00583 [Oesophagostomum dentatum]
MEEIGEASPNRSQKATGTEKCVFSAVWKQLGFLHRDIKPGNFAIGRQDTNEHHIIYMLDFGLCRKFQKKEIEILLIKIVSGNREIYGAALTGDETMLVMLNWMNDGSFLHPCTSSPRRRVDGFQLYGRLREAKGGRKRDRDVASKNWAAGIALVLLLRASDETKIREPVVDLLPKGLPARSKQKYKAENLNQEWGIFCANPFANEQGLCAVILLDADSKKPPALNIFWSVKLKAKEEFLIGVPLQPPPLEASAGETDGLANKNLEFLLRSLRYWDKSVFSSCWTATELEAVWQADLYIFRGRYNIYLLS